MATRSEAPPTNSVILADDIGLLLISTLVLLLYHEIKQGKQSSLTKARRRRRRRRAVMGCSGIQHLVPVCDKHPPTLAIGVSHPPACPRPRLVRASAGEVGGEEVGRGWGGGEPRVRWAWGGAGPCSLPPCTANGLATPAERLKKASGCRHLSFHHPGVPP